MSQTCDKLYKLVEELEHLCEESIPIIPGHFVVLKQKELAGIIRSLPEAINRDIEDSRIVLRKKEEIIQEARMKADRIIAEAESDRHRILSESSILRDIEEKAQKFRQEVVDECQDIKMKAFNEAEDVRLKASEEAIKIKDGAQEYARSILTKLEGDLNQLYQVVMNGQQYLMDMKADDEYNQRMAGK